MALNLEEGFQLEVRVAYFTFNDCRNLKNLLAKLKKIISILHQKNIDFIDLKLI